MYAKCIHILYIIWSFKYFFTVLLTHTDKKVLFCCNIYITQLIPLMVSKPAGIFARFFWTYYFLLLAHFFTCKLLYTLRHNSYNLDMKGCRIKIFFNHFLNLNLFKPYLFLLDLHMNIFIIMILLCTIIIQSLTFT